MVISEFHPEKQLIRSLGGRPLTFNTKGLKGEPEVVRHLGLEVSQKI